MGYYFNEWSKKGVWKRLFEEVQDPDCEWLFVESTVVRAHQHAAGMNTGGEGQDLGRSVGGFSTKLHRAGDSLGNPVAMHLTPCQAHDSKHALEVIIELQPGAVREDGKELAQLGDVRGDDDLVPLERIQAILQQTQINKAYNSPCAFSDFTTCPTAPRQNVLRVWIEAGEKSLK